MYTWAAWGVRERPGSQLSLIPVPEPASCRRSRSQQQLTFPILTSQHSACEITLSSQALPHILFFLLLLSLHLLMVFTINPSLVLLACSKQMERRLRLPLASLSLSSLRHPSCAAPPRLCTHSNNVSIPPESVIPVPPVSRFNSVYLFCTRYPTMHFNIKVQTSEFQTFNNRFYWSCFYCESLDCSLDLRRKCQYNQRNQIGDLVVTWYLHPFYWFMCTVTVLMYRVHYFLRLDRWEGDSCIIILLSETCLFYWWLHNRTQ